MTQICGRCKEEKSITDFSPSRRGKSGYPCRSCVALESQLRRDSFGQDESYKCGKCRKILPADNFTASKRTNGAYCKACCAEVARSSRLDSFSGDLSLERKLLRYGITKEEYNDLLLSQMGRCAICSEFLADELHTDHNEETGKVRGLLCGQCNRGIGLLKHDPDRLIAAAMYLMQEVNLLSKKE